MLHSALIYTQFKTLNYDLLEYFQPPKTVLLGLSEAPQASCRDLINIFTQMDLPKLHSLVSLLPPVPVSLSLFLAFCLPVDIFHILEVIFRSVLPMHLLDCVCAFSFNEL